MTITVALVGRPNVGKSTLFNRLVGKKLALVDDTPGVTRDRREGNGRISDLKFRVFDTAGLEEAFDESLEARMRQQTEIAIADADAVMLIVDARTGITPTDQHFANWLRTMDLPVFVVANKCEGKGGENGRLEAYALGLGDPLPISAEHGEGMVHLYDALRPIIDADDMDNAAAQAQEEWERQQEIEAKKLAAKEATVTNADVGTDEDISPEFLEGFSDEDEAEGEVEDPKIPLQLAIVGRPNVGKSTLINRLIGEDRMLTGPEAGITRDSIGVEWTEKGRAFKLFDTAGLRRRSRVTSKLESLSAADTLRAARFAQVVILVLDADDMLEKQDLTIARKVIDEGRALIICVNKWDTVRDHKAALGRLTDRLQTSLPQVRGVPIVTLSAKTGKHVQKLIPAVLSIYDVWKRRISTSRLNRWLGQMQEMHPPPLASGRRVRIRFMTQGKTRPPTFMLFVSRPTALPASYLRFLANGLREDFDLPGVPLRLLMRKGKNPYAPKK